MATHISSISSSPIARVVAKRDGGGAQNGEHFKEELAKQDNEASEIPEAADIKTNPSSSPPANDGVVGTHLDITG